MSQEQVNALQAALINSQEQVHGLSQQLDQLRADATATAAGTSAQLDTLRQESSNAVANLRAQVSELETGRDKKDNKGNKLINLKNFEPKIFSGKDGDPVKPWQKQIRNYCNAKQKGFRVALEWAEMQTDTITNDDLLGTDWAPAELANEELFEYLQSTTTGEALLIVEKYKDRGFEAWRQLAKRYNPTDGTFELDRMDGLLHRKQCKDLTDVPAAVDRLVRDIDDYETRSQSGFPADWKTLLLKQLLPKEYKKELEMRFSMGEKNFEKIAANIVGYSNDERVRAQRVKHSNGMDVDNIEAAKQQREQDEYGAYVADLEAYYYSEDPDLSWLGNGKGPGKWFKMGKGKGKGNK